MTEEIMTKKIELENANEARTLFGNSDNHLKRMEEEFEVALITRGERLHINGYDESVSQVEKIIQQLLRVIRNGIQISERDIVYAIQLSKQGRIDYFSELFEEEIGKTIKGKPIRVKTLGQREYIEAIRKNDLVFGIGPAGTGKTYLAVVMAVN